MASHTLGNNSERYIGFAKVIHFDETFATAKLTLN
jgi:hypothetical protein